MFHLQANIQAIMGSEMHLAELMNRIDATIDEAGQMEQILESYDELLLVKYMKNIFNRHLNSISAKLIMFLFY